MQSQIDQEMEALENQGWEDGREHDEVQDDFSPWLDEDTGLTLTDTF